MNNEQYFCMKQQNSPLLQHTSAEHAENIASEVQWELLDVTKFVKYSSVS